MQCTYIYKSRDLPCRHPACPVCHFYTVIRHVPVDADWAGSVHRTSVGNPGNTAKFWVLGPVFLG